VISISDKLTSIGVLTPHAAPGPEAEAVFIGGNGFPAAGAIQALEEAIGRPVLEANQVLLWTILSRAGATFRVEGYGKLFAHEPPPGAS
jgi:maleate cis-trans isomerase